MEQTNWAENIIIADGDYIDRVAFNLIVNFERMLGRRIPQADLALWAECIARDGGLKDGDHQTHVVLIHDSGKGQLDNFSPSDYASELNGQAFRCGLGEVSISAVSTEGLATKESLFTDTLQLVYGQKEVKRLMVIPDEHSYKKVREALRDADDEKRITLFAMQPMPGGAFRQEILGYSLMAALGIRSSEIEAAL